VTLSINNMTLSNTIGECIISADGGVVLIGNGTVFAQCGDQIAYAKHLGFIAIVTGATIQVGRGNESGNTTSTGLVVAQTSGLAIIENSNIHFNFNGHQHTYTQQVVFADQGQIWMGNPKVNWVMDGGTTIVSAVSFKTSNNGHIQTDGTMNLIPGGGIGAVVNGGTIDSAPFTTERASVNVAGTTYGGSASGTMTWDTVAGSAALCTTAPVLNVTQAAGAITGVPSIATAGFCVNYGALSGNTWIPGGGLTFGAGVKATFNLSPPMQPWLSKANNVISGAPNCADGGGNAVVTVNATDNRGSVTMGTLATACDITLRLLYPAPPFCTYNSSPPAAGLSVTPFAGSPGIIRVLQTAQTGNVISFVCPP
jgi:hypothetical protein